MSEVNLNKVLFATDLSPESRNAFEFMMKICSGVLAEIIILHVLDKDTPVTDAQLKTVIGSDRLKYIKGKKIEQARDIIIGKKRDYTGGKGKNADTKQVLKIREKMVSGSNIPNQICEVAAEENCNMIVIGMHHRKGLEKIIGKGTASNVIEKAEMPVLVFPLDGS